MIYAVVRLYRNGADGEHYTLTSAIDTARLLIDANEAGLDTLGWYRDRDARISMGPGLNTIGDVLWFDYGWFGIGVAGTTIDRLRAYEPLAKITESEA